MATSSDYNNLSIRVSEKVLIPGESILSRTLRAGEQARAILIAFTAGQELSKRTASTPAILPFLEGNTRLTLALNPGRGPGNLGACRLGCSTASWARQPS